MILFKSAFKCEKKILPASPASIFLDAIKGLQYHKVIFKQDFNFFLPLSATDAIKNGRTIFNS